MKSVYFSAEHDKLREEARAFLEREVVPYADEWESKRRIPKSIWRSMGNQGYLGLHQKRSVGGQERDFFHSVVFLEEVGRTGLAGFRAATAVHAYMAADYLATVASPELQQEYLVPAIRGEKLAALALSEPEAGSDISRITTRAERVGDEYVLSGTKAFVTSGYTGDFLVLVARTGAIQSGRRGAAGLSVFIVDNECDGIEREELHKIGWHCSDTANMRLDGVTVPTRNLVGLEGRGFQYIMQCLQLERLVAALVAIGGADACLEATQARVRARQVYGAPVAMLQTVRHELATLHTELAAARQLVYHTAWLYDRGHLPVTECSMAKLKATELANRVVDSCLQLHGGSGYLESSNMARMYRDTRIATIVGGTSEVMRDIIAQEKVDGVNLGSLRSTSSKAQWTVP